MNQPPYSMEPPRRQGMPVWAIVGIVLGGCAILAIPIIMIVAAILFPVMAQAREAARNAACQSHLKQVSVGIMMYAQDHNGALPPKESWQDAVMPYVREPGVLRCPSAPDLAVGYAYNAALDGVRLQDIPSPAQQPMVFDSHLGTANASDELGSFALRHGGRSGPGSSGNIAYADGSVKRETAAPAAVPAPSG